MVIIRITVAETNPASMTSIPIQEMLFFSVLGLGLGGALDGFVETVQRLEELVAVGTTWILEKSSDSYCRMEPKFGYSALNAPFWLMFSITESLCASLPT